MKTAAIIDEFNNDNPARRQWLAQIRQLHGPCRIIAVMSGDFTQQGLPASMDKYRRAALAIAEGVDMVIQLPVYCTLSSPDTYAFAAVSLLENLHCVDELYVACDTPDPGLLMQTAHFLFAENIQYQKKLKGLRQTGISFYEAQARAAESFIPGAGALLETKLNAFSAEYLRALKRMYSRIRPCLIPVAGWQDPTETAPAAQGYLSTLLKYTLACGPRDLDQISGGTAALTAAIRQAQDQYSGFEDFCRRLATSTRSPANIRRFMLSAILNLRKSDMALCRLYSFALYAQILAVSPDAAELPAYISSHTRLPVLGLDPEAAAAMTPPIRRMTHFDDRAHVLYTLAGQQN